MQACCGVAKYLLIKIISQLTSMVNDKACVAYLWGSENLIQVCSDKWVLVGSCKCKLGKYHFCIGPAFNLTECIFLSYFPSYHMETTKVPLVIHGSSIGPFSNWMLGRDMSHAHRVAISHQSLCGIKHHLPF